MKETRNRVKQFREKSGWTQSELARKVNVDRAYINRIENNDQQPGRKTMEKLIDVFDCNYDDLFFTVSVEKKLPHNRKAIAG